MMFKKSLITCLCVASLAGPVRADFTSMMPDPGDAASAMVWMMRTMMSMFNILTGDEDFDFSAGVGTPGSRGGFGQGVGPMTGMGMPLGAGWPGMSPMSQWGNPGVVPWQDKAQKWVDKGRSALRSHPVEGRWVGQGGSEFSLISGKMRMALAGRTMMEGPYRIRNNLIAVALPNRRGGILFRFELRNNMLALANQFGQLMFFQRYSESNRPSTSTVVR
ncbi:MAG TPA: hypothetical protein EYN73_06780 [Chromatiaceae bacterium]|jgi:hypothetical protein|nr:hypothetical protein [Chromatiaceae bacterium]HIA08755.1 hypothetical protein [Chromatiaceae bacterium]HIB83338.1 hypothetical protein [Chromatiaceae bacterium]HIN82434.1 hypothetical protein [Chromatiales bacterium]